MKSLRSLFALIGSTLFLPLTMSSAAFCLSSFYFFSAALTWLEGMALAVSIFFLMVSSAFFAISFFFSFSSFSFFFFSSSSLSLVSLILTSSFFKSSSRFFRLSSYFMRTSLSRLTSSSFFCLASFQTWPGARLERGGSFVRFFSTAWRISSKTSATSWPCARSLIGI